MNKAIIWTILISILIGTSTFLVWFFFFNLSNKIPSLPQLSLGQTNFVTPKSAPLNSSITSGTSVKQKLSIFTSKLIFSATLDKQKNKVVFYDTSGRLNSANLDGSDVLTADLISISNLANLVWSPDGSKVIQTTGNDNNRLFSTFLDIQTNSQKSLGNLEALTFSPDSKKIAWQETQNTDINNLITIGIDEKNKKSTPIYLRSIKLDWPVNNIISLTSKTSGKFRGSLWLLNTTNNNLTKVLNGFGLETLWSPQGNKVLFSETDEGGTNLKLGLYDVGQRSSFNIRTLASKCVWSKDNINIYCAIPHDLTDLVLPDDYLEKKIFTQDSLWKINTQDGSRKLLTENIGDGYNLFLAPNEDILFFISKQDSKLYKLLVQ